MTTLKLGTCQIKYLRSTKMQPVENITELSFMRVAAP